MEKTNSKKIIIAIVSVVVVAAIAVVACLVIANQHTHRWIATWHPEYVDVCNVCGYQNPTQEHLRQHKDEGIDPSTTTVLGNSMASVTLYCPDCEEQNTYTLSELEAFAEQENDDQVWGIYSYMKESAEGENATA